MTQEVSITTGGYSGTDTDQLQDNIETLNGGDKHGSLAYSSSNPESDENYSGKFLNPKCCDELVGHLALSSHRTYQEIIDAQQEQLQYYKKKIQQLELELGTRSFLDDKKKRNEKAYGQSSRTLACAKSKSCTGTGGNWVNLHFQQEGDWFSEAGKTFCNKNSTRPELSER